jgi:hypothetical protein
VAIADTRSKGRKPMDVLWRVLSVALIAAGMAGTALLNVDSRAL